MCQRVVLSGIGGILGIGAGIGVVETVSKVAGMDVVYSLDVIGVAFDFSVFIGVVFGLIPANKAAKMKTIDALRFE